MSLKNPVTPLGIDPGTVRLVTQRLNHNATPGPKLYDEELNYLYCSPDIVRVIKSRTIRWAVHVARMGEIRVVYWILVRETEGKRPLGRPRRRGETNIKKDFPKVGWWGGV
jgi:hypothetical protein